MTNAVQFQFTKNRPQITYMVITGDAGEIWDGKLSNWAQLQIHNHTWDSKGWAKTAFHILQVYAFSVNAPLVSQPHLEVRRFTWHTWKNIQERKQASLICSVMWTFTSVLGISLVQGWKAAQLPVWRCNAGIWKQNKRGETSIVLPTVTRFFRCKVIQYSSVKIVRNRPRWCGENFLC